VFWWNRGVKRSLNNDLDLCSSLLCKQGVTGSIPVTSTKLFNDLRSTSPRESEACDADCDVTAFSSVLQSTERAVRLSKLGVIKYSAKQRR
jgi:hypothetical protein